MFIFAMFSLLNGMFFRLLFVNFFIVFSFSNVFAQGEMVFTEETFDFGNVVEGTVAAHEFVFINNGKEPVIISNVQASCGCTTPFWTKEPVGAGSKGIVKASYNSAGRPGAFTKTITITSNAKSPSKFLTIKGVVTPKPLISPSSQVTLDAQVYDLGKIVKGRKIHKSISILNSGDAPLSIASIESGCKCISYNTLPADIKPGERAQVDLFYIPRQAGVFSEPVTLTTNDKNNSQSKLYFKAQIEEDTSFKSVVKESQTSVPFN
jgi:hypothetical protein